MDANIESVLIMCLEYFEGRQDADYQGEEDGFVPNEEMKLAAEIKEILDGASR